MADLSPTREVARYEVEIRWHPPRTWGPQSRLPHGGRFYAHARFSSPDRDCYVYVQATGAIGSGGVETTELAILTAADGPSVPDIRTGEAFELVRGRVAADGRVIRKIN